MLLRSASITRRLWKRREAKKKVNGVVGRGNKERPTNTRTDKDKAIGSESERHRRFLSCYFLRSIRMRNHSFGRMFSRFCSCLHN